MQLYTDKCIPWGEGIACVTVFITLLHHSTVSNFMTLVLEPCKIKVVAATSLS